MRRGGVSVWRGGLGSRVRYPSVPTTVSTMDSVLAMDASAQRTSQVSLLVSVRPHDTIGPHITHHHSVTSDLCRCGLFYPCVQSPLENSGLYHHW